MADRMTVYVNDRPVRIFRGMAVRHALIAADETLYRAARAGDVIVEDGSGFRVGLEGSLDDGARIYTRPMPHTTRRGKTA